MIYDLEKLKGLISNFININKNIFVRSAYYNEINPKIDILEKITAKLTDIEFAVTNEDSYKDYFNFVDANNGVAVSLMSREEINITRDYHKRTDGNMDLYPFGDLFLSEILDLAKYLNIKSEPTDTKWYSFKDIEDMDFINKRTNIIFDESQPSSYKEWYSFTLPQKEMIIKLHHREKQTRHKKISKDRILDVSELRI